MILVKYLPMSSSSHPVIQSIIKLGNPIIAEKSQRFFKTGAGDYAEGDRFLGISVPNLRNHLKAPESHALNSSSVIRLLQSEWHEVRLFALFWMVSAFKKSKDHRFRSELYELYLDNTCYVNNWDLVDSSAPHIVGGYLLMAGQQDKLEVLDQLAASSSLWERRISIIATQAFIRKGEFNQTIRLARQLIADREDLLHKAVGWMLREVGKKDLSVLRGVLDCHALEMPRTMLRYAIEKLPENERQWYLRSNQ